MPSNELHPELLDFLVRQLGDPFRSDLAEALAAQRAIERDLLTELRDEQCDECRLGKPIELHRGTWGHPDRDVMAPCYMDGCLADPRILNRIAALERGGEDREP